MPSFKQIAEMVLRPLAGGDISADFPIKSQEVYAYILAEIPALMKADTYEGYKLTGITGIDNAFYTTFTGSLQDKNGNEKFIPLPGTPVMLHGKGKPFVYYCDDRNVNFTYVDMTAYTMLNANRILQEFSGPVMFIENIENEDGIKESRLVIIGADQPLSKVNVRYIQSVQLSDLDENDEVPLPGHLVDVMIKDLKQVFGQFLGMKEDQQIDGRIDN
jgi:hypothetical protein